MNWKELECIDCKKNQKTGNQYCQKYLTTSLYVEFYFHWVDREDIIDFYHSVLSELKDQFAYHHNSKKHRESKMRDKLKVFSQLENSIEKMRSSDHFWFLLSDRGGVGSEKELGGVGNAEAHFFIRGKRFSEEALIKEINLYKENLEEFQLDFLPGGVPSSSIRILFPRDHFSSFDDFRNWILDQKFVRKGDFLSGSAGYSLNIWTGYSSQLANEKRDKILKEFPGFDLANGAGFVRMLDKSRSNFLPSLKRVNWLNFISSLGVDTLGGIQTIKTNLQDKNLSFYSTGEGLCIQCSPEPVIDSKDPRIKIYSYLAKTLEPLLPEPFYINNRIERYAGLPTKIGTEWMYYFHSRDYSPTR